MPQFKRHKDYAPYQLRDYQLRLITDAKEALQEAPSLLTTAPTGAGKTVTLSDICEKATLSGRNTVVMVHRQELVKQTVKTLRQAGWHRPRSRLEKAPRVRPARHGAGPRLHCRQRRRMAGTAPAPADHRRSPPHQGRGLDEGHQAPEPTLPTRIHGHAVPVRPEPADARAIRTNQEINHPPGS